MSTITGTGSAVTGLGGAAGYGETALPRGDDTFARADVSAVFEQGFLLAGTRYAADRLFISTDGFVTFGTGVAAMPTAPKDLTMPFLAIFMADVDTRLDGEGPESGQIWLDVDAASDVVTITWDHVGFYRRNASVTDTFQMQLYDRGGGAMDVVFRYDHIGWTTGDLQGGHGGLGGTAAFIGYRELGQGLPATLAASRDGAAQLALPTTLGNTGVAGLVVFRFGGSGAPIQGGAGNDTLMGTSRGELIKALGGDDVILGSGGPDTVYGGAGQDVLDLSAAPRGLVLDLADSAAGTGWAKGLQLFGVEAVIGSGLSDRLAGTTGADWLAGWGGADSILGRDGADSLWGQGGDDTLIGGTGNDRLEGGAGADSLVGGPGADVLAGGPGADTLDGGTGIDRADFSNAGAGLVFDLTTPANATGAAAGDRAISVEQVTGSAFADTLSGAAGSETLWGQGDGDWLRGMGGNDRLWGGDGADRIEGMQGADIAWGGVGRDTLRGGDGADSLWGGGADDLIFGGAQNDQLGGDQGADMLFGGTGADLFISSGQAGAGADRIGDYSAAEGDVLRITRAGLTAADLTLSVETRPGLGQSDVAEAVIRLAATGQILWVLVDAVGQPIQVQSASDMSFWLA